MVWRCLMQTSARRQVTAGPHTQHPPPTSTLRTQYHNKGAQECGTRGVQSLYFESEA
jgi:hypothetical protein